MYVIFRFLNSKFRRLRMRFKSGNRSVMSMSRSIVSWKLFKRV